jgi:glycosyltransferase involved in cell wall biosynthesis
MANENKTPMISVFTSCKNGGRFLKETLGSIFCQTYSNFEIVLVDGASTDNTLETLHSYSHDKRLRWISEPDKDAAEGFRKALSMVQGNYIMCMPVSDGFLDKNWFKKCVDILENDDEVSLVWGMVQFMNEEGGLIHVGFHELFEKPEIQKYNFFPFWAATHFHLFEMNYCVRADVYKACFPEENRDDLLDEKNPYIKFDYNFNSKGYLPYFIPEVASFARVHSDSRNYAYKEIIEKGVNSYFDLTQKYINKVLSGEIVHVFRDGNSIPVKSIEKSEIKNLRKQINIHRYFTHNNLFFWRCDENRNFYLQLKKREPFLKRVYWKWLLLCGKL